MIFDLATIFKERRDTRTLHSLGVNLPKENAACIKLMATKLRYQTCPCTIMNAPADQFGYALIAKLRGINILIRIGDRFSPTIKCTLVGFRGSGFCLITMPQGADMSNVAEK